MLDTIIARPLVFCLRATVVSFLLIGISFAGQPLFADPTNFEISEQPMKSALTEFARQSDREILFSTDAVADKEAPLLKGIYEDERALELLLADSGLEYSVTASNTILVAEEGGDSEAKKLSWQPTSIAPSSDGGSGGTSVAAAVESAARSGEAEGSADDDDDMEEIIVTGSQLITDPGKLTRQITVFNRAEIERSGATRLDEFLRRLPQNVNAPNNVGSGFRDREIYGLGENVFAESTINLRGLGAQYTLILINGRRPARGGQYGEVTDISSIPIDRIERIEVLFDGAAAIYGADAVGGVVNIITRKDYGGTHLSLTYNDTEDGGGAQTNLQLGHTFNWGSGSLTATVGYQTQEQIEGNQRSDIALSPSIADTLGTFFLPPSANGNVRAMLANIDLSAPEYRALFWVNGDERLSGGVEVPAIQLDFSTGQFVETTTFVNRQTGQLPFGYFWIDEAAHRPVNPETLGFTPVFQADLPQYSGQALGLGEVGTSNELGQSVYVPYDGLALSPEDDTYNVGLSFAQDLSDDLRLTLNADYSDTSRVSFNAEGNGRALIMADSPANPFGEAFFYSYQDRFPQQYQDIESSRYNVSGGIDWDITADWNLAFGFGYSAQENDSRHINVLRTGGFGPDTVEARMNGYYNTVVPDSSPPVFERGFTGSHFNDPLLGYDSFEEMVAALVIPLQRTTNHSTLADADLRLMGKLFALPGGDVRASLSAGYREDETEVFNSDGLIFVPLDGPLTPPPDAPIEIDYDERFGENVKSLSAELAVPVFGGDFDLPLVDSLLLSVAGRAEDYSNTDEDGFNWAAGFNWGVNEQFTVRLNRTYSLSVPASVRTAQAPRWGFAPSYRLYNDPNDSFPAIIVDEPLWVISGGADHLRPDRTYGTMLSFIYRPAFAEGLDIQVNLTRSHTFDQIGNPFAENNWTVDTVLPESVRGNPLLDYGDPENNASHASAAAIFGGQVVRMAPGDLVADRRVFNIGDTSNQGADFQIGYNLATRFGDWLLTWRHQYLDTQKIRRTNVCEQVEQGCAIDVDSLVEGLDEPIDIVGSVSRGNFDLGFMPLPRNRGSVELFWQYRGLGVNLSTLYESTTSVFRTEDVLESVVVGYIEFNGQRIPITEARFVGTNTYREDSRSAQPVHFALSYDFGRGSLFDAPGFLGDARLQLTINNLFMISERKQSLEVVDQQADVVFEGLRSEINRFTIEPRGQTYTLLFSTTF